MQYAIIFLEGLISFISPCVLPLLPVYLSYFAGGLDGEKKVLPRAAAFVCGFTLVFCLLGVFAGALGAALSQHRRLLELVCGAVVVLFGLAYLGLLPLDLFRGMQSGRQVEGLFSAFLFGLIYAISLGPCVGAFLGSAIMMASPAGGMLRGLPLLLLYSLGLGLPFLLSALLLESLAAVFAWIKRHYRLINTVSGILLILLGILMMCGLLTASI